MREQQITDFFDPEIQRIVSSDGCSVYKMKNKTGEGVITRYGIFPGIELFYNDFHMGDGENKNKLPQPGVLEINHCREGRFECVFENGDRQYIGAGDLCINRLTNKTVSTFFPMSHYHGISITIETEAAAGTIRALESVMGNLQIDLEGIAERFCQKELCYVLRGRDAVAHIFHELYQAPPEMASHYLKVKVLELLMYLNDTPVADYPRERRYFSKNQIQTVRQMEAYMKKHLSRHDTLKELSERFDIPLTTMKTCFKSVYGCSIYAYMKSYRMQAAMLLLRDTADSITEIAAKMGYDNPSKFSEMFKKEFGELPSDFRKSLSK